MSNFNDILARELQNDREKRKTYASQKTTEKLVKNLGTVSYLMDVRDVQAYKAVLKERGIQGVPE